MQHEPIHNLSFVLDHVTVELDPEIPLGVYVAWNDNGYIDFGDARRIRFDAAMTNIAVNPGLFAYMAKA